MRYIYIYISSRTSDNLFTTSVRSLERRETLNTAFLEHQEHGWWWWREGGREYKPLWQNGNPHLQTRTDFAVQKDGQKTVVGRIIFSIRNCGWYGKWGWSSNNNDSDGDGDVCHYISYLESGGGT